MLITLVEELTNLTTYLHPLLGGAGGDGRYLPNYGTANTGVGAGGDSMAFVCNCHI